MSRVGPGQGVRLLVGLLACVALVIAAVGLLSETTPPHGRTVDSIFEDDQLLIDAPPGPAGTTQVQDTLLTMKLLGADRIRVLVDWNAVAPNAKDAYPPANFNAADPRAYGSGFAELDRLDTLAKLYELTVDFDVAGPAPLWAATTPPGGVASHYDAVYEPSVRDYGQFVQAIAKRYDGSFRPAGVKTALPRVSYWSVWNEPNQAGWIAPQQDAAGDLTAPAQYRSLVDAAWSALHQTGHGADTILVGELAPLGCTTVPRTCFDPTGEHAVPPLNFLAALYCVNLTGRRLSGSAATAVGCPSGGSAQSFVSAHPALFDATGFSEHPYNFNGPPTQTFGDPADSGFVPLSEIGHLETALDRAYSAYGSKRQIPLYLTEYGYETDPPKPFAGATPAQQASYIDQATYLVYQDPRIRALGQFELRDSAKSTYGWFPEGLEFINGKAKPAYTAYRLPIWVPNPDTPLAGTTTVWGMLRPALNGSTQTALIQFRSARDSGWRTLATTTTRDPSNFIQQRVTLPSSGLVRIAWNPPGNHMIYSEAVAVTVG